MNIVFFIIASVIYKYFILFKLDRELD